MLEEYSLTLWTGILDGFFFPEHQGELNQGRLASCADILQTKLLRLL